MDRLSACDIYELCIVLVWGLELKMCWLPTLYHLHAVILTLCDLWNVAYQASLSVDFSRHVYWSRKPFTSPRDFPNPGIKPGSPALHTDSLAPKPPGKPKSWMTLTKKKKVSKTRCWSKGIRFQLKKNRFWQFSVQHDDYSHQYCNINFKVAKRLAHSHKW